MAEYIIGKKEKIVENDMRQQVVEYEMVEVGE